MAYTPTKWTNNTTITAAQLNKLEEGVADTHEVADTAARAIAEVESISNGNSEDIAQILDELEELRIALSTISDK